MAFLVLFALFSFASFAYGEEVNVDRFDIRKSSDLPLNETEIAEMVEKNTPAIDPTNFESKKADKSTLAVYGEVPVKNGTASYDWHLLLFKITDDIKNDSDFQKYSAINGGPLTSYGSKYTDGFIQVNVDFKQADLLKQEDLDQIQKIFEKYANENGIKNLPIVIATNENVRNVATVSNDDVTRPVIGGVNAQGTYPTGSNLVKPNITLGYPVIKNNNSLTTRGFITVAHLFPENGTVGSLYQPEYSSSNFVAGGLINNINSQIDAIYVKFANVEPAIHVGDDPVLSAKSRTSENESKMMIYGSSNPSGELRRFGKATGNTGGYYIGYERNFKFDRSDKYLDTVYIMNATDGDASIEGDSGGPIYIGMNVTISGKTDYQAFMVGITNGRREYINNGTCETIFAPQSEIDYYLDVRPYWSRTATLT
jgi:hypothetical protein